MSLRSELRAEIAALQRKLDALPPRPDEPCVIELGVRNELYPVTIRFAIKFGRVGGSPSKLYHYVACRLDGKWFLTGSESPQKVTWSELWDWIERLGGLAPDTAMHVVTRWQSV